MVVFQMTGDERWLRAPYLPTRGQGLGDHDSGGLPEAVQSEAHILRSRNLLQRTADSLNLVQVPEFNTTLAEVTSLDRVKARVHTLALMLGAKPSGPP